MSFGTIILLLLFLGITMYSKTKKTFVEQDVLPDVPADEEPDVADEYFSDEVPASQEPPYFTYETEAAEVPVYKTVSKAKPRPAFVPVAEESSRSQFDLRQAVIGQVILTNNYINEINQ